MAGGALLAFMMFFGSFNVLVMRKGLNDLIVGTEDILILSLVLVAAILIPFGETAQQLLIFFAPFYHVLAACVALYAVVLLSDYAQLLKRGEIRSIPLE